jgi:hypothetical protein
MTTLTVTSDPNVCRGRATQYATLSFAYTNSAEISSGLGVDFQQKTGWDLTNPLTSNGRMVSQSVGYPQFLPIDAFG